MSVATYADLAARVQTLLARTDLAANVPLWVDAAERAIVSELRVRQMEKVAAPLFGSGGEIALPDDLIAPGEVRLADNLKVSLDFLPTDRLYDFEDAGFGSGAGFWSVLGNSLVIRPRPDDAQGYWLKYFFRPAPLSADQQTNEIFPAYSDLYVYGTVWQAYEHVRNREQAAGYLQKMIAAIGQYNARWDMEKHGTGSLRVRPRMSA